uniref:Uncharacterized protein n=1 Tax=Ciona intestinalis TaxID=7719 RepID=F6ZMV4_CIOIN
RKGFKLKKSSESPTKSRLNSVANENQTDNAAETNNATDSAQEATTISIKQKDEKFATLVRVSNDEQNLLINGENVSENLLEVNGNLQKKGSDVDPATTAGPGILQEAKDKLEQIVDSMKPMQGSTVDGDKKGDRKKSTISTSREGDKRKAKPKMPLFTSKNTKQNLTTSNMKKQIGEANPRVKQLRQRYGSTNSDRSRTPKAPILNKNVLA